MIKNSFAPVPKSHTQRGFIDVKKTRGQNSHAWAPLTLQPLILGPLFSTGLNIFKNTSDCSASYSGTGSM
jgi:hypothetical protein